jgi:hypothetical protein
MRVTSFIGSTERHENRPKEGPSPDFVCAQFGSLGPFWGERVDRQVLPYHGVESGVYRLPGVDSFIILGIPLVVETTPAAFEGRG